MKLEYYEKIVLTAYIHRMYCSATSICESHGLTSITNVWKKKLYAWVCRIYDYERGMPELGIEVKYESHIYISI
jgi:hypothetical protein